MHDDHDMMKMILSWSSASSLMYEMLRIRHLEKNTGYFDMKVIFHPFQIWGGSNNRQAEGKSPPFQGGGILDVMILR